MPKCFLVLLIENMNILRNFVLIVISYNFQAIFCYVASQKPTKLTDRSVYVFFNTECTQDLEKCDGSFEHIPNLICAQQMCSKCESVDDLSVCEQCGKRTHVLAGPCRQIYYLRQSRQFADKIYVSLHNSRA